MAKICWKRTDSGSVDANKLKSGRTVQRREVSQFLHCRQDPAIYTMNHHSIYIPYNNKVNMNKSQFLEAWHKNECFSVDVFQRVASKLEYGQSGHLLENAGPNPTNVVVVEMPARQYIQRDNAMRTLLPGITKPEKVHLQLVEHR